MSEKRALGVSAIKIGDIAADGDVATAFAALGVTYKDTASIEQTEGDDTEHECEEFDDPIEVVPGAKKTTIKWAIVDFTPATLVKVLGGTVTGTAPNEKWVAPSTAEVIEKSVQITPKSGPVFTYPRVSLKASVKYDLKKSGIAQVNITGKVLTPTKTGVQNCTIG